MAPGGAVGQSAAACGFSPATIETTTPLPSMTAPGCGSGVIELELVYSQAMSDDHGA